VRPARASPGRLRGRGALRGGGRGLRPARVRRLRRRAVPLSAAPSQGHQRPVRRVAPLGGDVQPRDRRRRQRDARRRGVARRGASAASSRASSATASASRRSASSRRASRTRSTTRSPPSSRAWRSSSGGSSRTASTASRPARPARCCRCSAARPGAAARSPTSSSCSRSRTPWRPTWVSVNRAVEDTISLLRYQTQHQNVNAVAEVDPALPEIWPRTAASAPSA